MRDIFVIIGSLIILTSIFVPILSFLAIFGGVIFLGGAFASDSKSNIKVITVGLILIFFSPLIGLLVMLAGTYLFG